MKPAQFMRIPFMVYGHQVTAQNMDAIAKWCQGYVVRDAPNPFVRVPVNRPTHKKQTEATIGTWVIVSLIRGERSFKVYTEERLASQFISLPNEPWDPGILDLEETPEVENPPRASNVRSIPTQYRPPTNSRTAP